MNVYYDYVFDGIWQKDDDIANSHMPTATPGSIKLRDVNNDNQITADDRVVMQRDPKWIGTVGTSFNYKGFDLSADLYISHGGTIYNPYLTTFENGGDLTAKRNGIRRNYWTQNNPSNEAPAPNMTPSSRIYQFIGLSGCLVCPSAKRYFRIQLPPCSYQQSIHAKSETLYDTV